MLTDEPMARKRAPSGEAQACVIGGLTSGDDDHRIGPQRLTYERTVQCPGTVPDCASKPSARCSRQVQVVCCINKAVTACQREHVSPAFAARYREQ